MKMKKALVFAVVLVALLSGVSFGATVRYHGNPRMVTDPGTVPGNAPGPGPFAFPGTAVFLDSSRNQFGIYVNRVLGTSHDGAVIVGKVIRQYLVNSRVLEAFTWTNGGNPPWTFTTDPNLNDPAVCSLGYPQIDFTGSDGEGFVVALGTDGHIYYIHNSGGYGSGLWDSPVSLDSLAQGAWGTWMPNHTVNLIVESGWGLHSWVLDLNGGVISGPTPMQCVGTADFRAGRLVSFGGVGYQVSTDYGISWGPPETLTISAGSPDSGFYQYQNVILLDGSSGVLLTMDDIHHPYSGVHSAVQFFAKGRPKVTIFSPTMTQAAGFPVIARKADNTLVALFMYAPVWDSVQWGVGRTFWDLAESYSTDGGLTWSSVRNLTNTPTVGECCPQVARFIGSNGVAHFTFGTSWRSSQPSDTADLYWAAEYAGGAQVKTYNYYKNTAPDTDAVTESKSFEIQNATFGLSPLNPNPMRGVGAITCQLPEPGRTSLAVYNSLGQRVRTMLDRVMPAGRFTSVWDGRDEAGNRVPSGSYFFRLCSGPFTRVREVVVLR